MGKKNKAISSLEEKKPVQKVQESLPQNKKPRTVKEEHQLQVQHKHVNNQKGSTKGQKQQSKQPNKNEKLKNKNGAPSNSNDELSTFQHRGKVVVTKYIEKEDELDNLPSLDEDGDLLKAFLYPVSPSYFLKNIWKKNAFATIPRLTNDDKSKTVKRIQNIIEKHLFNLKLEGLLSNTASDSIFVWMRPLESILKSADDKMTDEKEENKEISTIDSFELQGESAVNSATICYNGGASLYFRSPEEMAEIFVRKLSYELGLNFAGEYSSGDNKGEIEVFVSRKGHVTDWHFDFMENFTIQLKGSKTWKLMKSDITHPIRGATPHYKGVDTKEQQLKVHHLKDTNFRLQPTDFSTVEEITLTEGSVFYFPAGLWHRVECNDDSISINISLIASNWADLMSDSIHHHLWSKDEWREGINFRDPKEARNHLGKLLQKLKDEVSALQVEDILPNSMFVPRKDEVDYEEEDEEELNADERISQISVNDTFRRNPVAVLIPLDEVPEAIEGEDEEDEEDEEGWIDVNEDDDNEEDECCGGGHHHDHKNGSEDGEEGEWEDDTDSEKVFYALHINFGNEELESAVRVKLSFPSELKSAVDWVRSKKGATTFKLADLVSFVKGSEEENDIEPEHLVRLVKILAYHGFINKVQDKSNK